MIWISPWLWDVNAVWRKFCGKGDSNEDFRGVPAFRSSLKMCCGTKKNFQLRLALTMKDSSLHKIRIQHKNLPVILAWCFQLPVRTFHCDSFLNFVKKYQGKNCGMSLCQRNGYFGFFCEHLIFRCSILHCWVRWTEFVIIFLWLSEHMGCGL